MAQFEPRREGASPGQARPVPMSPEARAREVAARVLAQNADDFLGLDFEVQSRVSSAATHAQAVQQFQPQNHVPQFVQPQQRAHPEPYAPQQQHAQPPQHARQLHDALPNPYAPQQHSAQHHSAQQQQLAQPQQQVQTHNPPTSFMRAYQPLAPSESAAAARRMAPSVATESATLAEPIATQTSVHAHASMLAFMHPTETELDVAPRAPETMRANSWLLELDDARAGRAGVEPVIAGSGRARVQKPATLDASFAEAPGFSERVQPWIVRGLIATAACAFVFVVGHTLLTNSKSQPRVSEAPLKPIEPDARVSEELADPKVSRRSSGRAGGSGNLSSPNASTPVRATSPEVAQKSVPNASAAARAATPRAEQGPSPRARTPELPTFIEIPPPEFAPVLPPNPNASESQGIPVDGRRDVTSLPYDVRKVTPEANSGTPADPRAMSPAPDAWQSPNGVSDPAADAQSWWPGALRSPPLARSELGPNPDELAASPLRRERVARWLMERSRGATPFDDVQAQYTQPVTQLASFAPFTHTPAPFPRESSAPSTDPASNTAPIVASVNGASASEAPTSDALPSGSAKRDAATNAAPAAITPSLDANVTEAATTVASVPLAVWEGATVPVDQIAAQVRILTPKVGPVRVVLDSGDAQDGRLYAVGLGQVWIDTDLGRVAFARARIERLEQLSPPSVPSTDVASSAPPAKDALPDLSPRVRVRTPGGLFYGRILAREGASMTLLTDEGVRITIESGEVDLAPARKTVLRREPAPLPKKVVAPAPAPAADAEYDPDNPHGLH